MRELLVAELNAVSGGTDLVLPAVIVTGFQWNPGFSGGGGGTSGDGSDWDTDRSGGEGGGGSCSVEACDATYQAIFIDHIRDVIRESGLSSTRELGTVLYGTGQNMLGHNAQNGSLGQLEIGPVVHAGSHNVPNTDLYYFADAAAQISGMIHNHPFNSLSSDERLINRYPSENDWEAAETLVAANIAAGGTGSFVLYIIDPWGEVRAFDYAARGYYESLGTIQKDAGVGLPGAMIDDDGQLAAMAAANGCSVNLGG
jgi:hypothetical protein